MALDSVSQQDTGDFGRALTITDFMPPPPVQHVDHASITLAAAGGTASDASTTSSPSNPGKPASAEISALKERIKAAQINQSGSLQLGEDLRRLGIIENGAGNYKDASDHLAQAVDVLRLQPQSKTIVQSLIQTYYDYGVSLVRRNSGGDEATAIADRGNADAQFDRAIQLARMYDMPAKDKADILREKGNNQVFLANSNETNTDLGRYAYRRDMKLAIETFNTGIDLMQGRISNPDLASRALITGDAAFAEMNLATSLTTNINSFGSISTGDANSVDAIAAAQHFEQAIQLWDTYQPKTKEESDARDKSEIALFAQYYRLSNQIGNFKRAKEINSRHQELLTQHPEFQTQN